MERIQELRELISMLQTWQRNIDLGAHSFTPTEVKLRRIDLRHEIKAAREKIAILKGQDNG